jgi:O-methyltransferase
MFYGRLKDPADRAFLKASIGRFRSLFESVFAADNVILFNRTLGFRNNKHFMDAIRKNVRNAQERSLLLRLNTLAWAGAHACNIHGDFVECGVWRGFCSSVVMDYLDFASRDKSFFLYDTFSGIPREYDAEKHDSPLFREAGLYESVVQRFARFPNAKIVRGLVPNSFSEALPDSIAFLHLDMNSSKSEIAALEVLFDRISPGGIVVFDDYGWLGYRAQQEAEDNFVQSRGHWILELPTGQGLLIKQPVT